MDGLDTKIQTFMNDMEIAHGIIHGDDTTQVVTEAGVTPSLAKALKDGLVDPSNTMVQAMDASKAARDEAIATAASLAVVISEAAPTSPVPGKDWVKASTGKRYTLMDDGTSQQWVELAGFYYVDDFGSVIEAREAAQDAREAVASVEEEVDKATAQVAAMAQQVQIAGVSASLSVTAKVAAEAARDASFVLGPKYLTEALGRAAVADNATFLVVGSGDTACFEYRRTNSTTSVLIASYPSVTAVSNVKQRAEGMTELFDNPNLFTDHDFSKWVAAAGEPGDATGKYFKDSNAILTQITTPEGRPGMRYAISGAATTLTDVKWRQRLSALGVAVGDKVSCSLRFLAGSVVGGSAGNTKLYVRQLTVAGAEITAARKSFLLPVGTMPADTFVEFAGNVIVEATAEYLEIFFSSNNSTTVVDIAEVLFAKGSLAAYRPSPGTYVDARAIAAAQALSLASQADIDRSLAPLFLRPNLLNNDWAAMVGTGGGTATRVEVSANGRPAVQVTSVGTEWNFLYPVGLFPSGNVVAGARVVDRSVTTAGRVLIIQLDGAGAEIAGTRVTLTAATTAVLPIALGGTAPLHASCVNVRLIISALNGAGGSTITYQDVYIADGQEQVFRPFTRAAVLTEAFVGPAGNDSIGKGTAAQPFATLNQAVIALGGSGVVWMLDGSYSAQSISPANVKGHVEVRGVRSNLATGSNDFPVIRMASKITGIIKTALRTKIYQAPVAGLPTLANFQWAYEDGVVDPRTLIADADRNPQHRGRTHRLHKFARLMKPTATTLAGALAEMDAASLPMAFVDNGNLYFTISSGGDGTAADIYLDAATGFVNGATRGSSGVLNVQGLEIRYGGLDLRAFKSSHLDEVVVAGSRVNAVDYNVLTYGTLEVCCGGSQDQFNGDGLNGHNGARLPWGLNLYSHDNWDDGFSDHEGCSSRLFGGLIEYNGGAAVIPANGSDNVTSNVISRRNQQRAGWKASAFHALGAPTEGYDTRALFVSCIDIESTQSFGDDMGGAATRAVAVDCKSIRPVTRGYSCYSISDCGYIAGAGSTARNAATLVENSTVVV